jgi:predicted  nucleic acid-binding Zn-ribbon protein
MEKEKNEYNTLVEAIKDLNRQFEDLNVNNSNNVEDVKTKREKIRGEIGKLQSEIDNLKRD